MRSALLTLTVAGLLSAGVVGCATNELETRREVASAALSKYPGGQPRSDVYSLTAIDNQGAKTIEILNPSTKSVPAGKIWVNGRYVANTTPILSRSSITVNYADLLAAGADVSDIAQSKANVVGVELQIGNELHAVQGPTVK